MTIGERIRLKRESLGMTQDELAKKLGYKYRSSINKIESDQQDLPQKKIFAIAKALDTTPDYILGYGDKQEPEEEIAIHTIAAHAFGKLSEEDAEKVLEFAQYLLSKENK